MTHTDTLGQRRYHPDPTIAGAERIRFHQAESTLDRDETGDDGSNDGNNRGSGNSRGTTGWDDNPGPPPF